MLLQSLFARASLPTLVWSDFLPVFSWRNKLDLIHAKDF